MIHFSSHFRHILSFNQFLVKHTWKEMFSLMVQELEWISMMDLVEEIVLNQIFFSILSEVLLFTHKWNIGKCWKLARLYKVFVPTLRVNYPFCTGFWFRMVTIIWCCCPEAYRHGYNFTVKFYNSLSLSIRLIFARIFLFIILLNQLHIFT